MLLHLTYLVVSSKRQQFVNSLITSKWERCLSIHKGAYTKRHGSQSSAASVIKLQIPTSVTYTIVLTFIIKNGIFHTF